MQAFDNLSPKSLKAAFQAIRGRGLNYEVVAGGTNFIPNLRDGTVRPKLVVDLGGLKTLNYIKEKNGQIKVIFMSVEIHKKGFGLKRGPCP